jgi:hypothetical protein
MAQKTGLSQTAIVHLARFWSAAASGGELQILQRPAVGRKGARYCRALYESPDRAMVLCVDEKSQVQALNRTQPILPLAPGVPASLTTTNGTE